MRREERGEERREKRGERREISDVRETKIIDTGRIQLQNCC